MATSRLEGVKFVSAHALAKLGMIAWTDGLTIELGLSEPLQETPFRLPPPALS